MERKLVTLLRDYGYRVDGRTLVASGTPGFSSARTVGTIRSVLDAAERVCPLVACSDYSRRLQKILNG